MVERCQRGFSPLGQFKIDGVIEREAVPPSEIEDGTFIRSRLDPDGQYRKTIQGAYCQTLGNSIASLRDQHDVSDFKPPMERSPHILGFGALPSFPCVLIALVGQEPTGRH